MINKIGEQLFAAKKKIFYGRPRFWDGAITNIHHDLVTHLASIFGLIATTGTFVGLYKAG